MFSNETKCFTELFTYTNLRAAYGTKNTVQYHVLPEKSYQREDKFRSSGVYLLTFPDIKMKYTGQTGRRFETRLKEHLTFLQEK